MEDQLLTRSEVARSRRVSLGLVNKWIYSLPEGERLPFVKVGSRTLISSQALDEFLQRNQSKWLAAHPWRKRPAPDSPVEVAAQT